MVPINYGFNNSLAATCELAPAVINTPQTEPLITHFQEPSWTDIAYLVGASAITTFFILGTFALRRALITTPINKDKVVSSINNNSFNKVNANTDFLKIQLASNIEKPFSFSDLIEDLRIRILMETPLDADTLQFVNKEIYGFIRSNPFFKGHKLVSILFKDTLKIGKQMHFNAPSESYCKIANVIAPLDKVRAVNLLKYALCNTNQEYFNELGTQDVVKEMSLIDIDQAIEIVNSVSDFYKFTMLKYIDRRVDCQNLEKTTQIRKILKSNSASHYCLDSSLTIETATFAYKKAKKIANSIEYDLFKIKALIDVCECIAYKNPDKAKKLSLKIEKIIYSIDMEKNDTSYSLLPELIKYLAKHDREKAIQLTENVVHKSWKISCYTLIAREWAKENLEEALAWIDSLQRNDKSYILKGFIPYISLSYPDKARELIENILHPSYGPEKNSPKELAECAMLMAPIDVKRAYEISKGIIDQKYLVEALIEIHRAISADNLKIDESVNVDEILNTILEIIFRKIGGGAYILDKSNRLNLIIELIKAILPHKYQNYRKWRVL